MSYEQNNNTNNTSGNEFGRQNDTSFGSDFNQSKPSATNDSYRESNSNSQGVDSFGGEFSSIPFPPKSYSLPP